MAFFTPSSNINGTRLEKWKTWRAIYWICRLIELPMVFDRLCSLIILPAHSLQEPVAHPVFTEIEFWYLLHALLFDIFYELLHSICFPLSELLGVTPDHTLVVPRLLMVDEDVLGGWLIFQVFLSNVRECIHVVYHFHIHEVMQRFNLLYFFWTFLFSWVRLLKLCLLLHYLFDFLKFCVLFH